MSQFAPIPCAVVNTNDLWSLARPAFEQVGSIPGYFEAQARFMQLIGQQTATMDPIDGACLSMRCLLLYELIFKHSKRLAAEGVVERPSGKGTQISANLVHAASAAPLKFRMIRDGVRLLYEIRDVVAVAKRPVPGAKLRSTEAWARDSVVDDQLVSGMDQLDQLRERMGLPTGLSLGEMLVGDSEGVEFAYELDDFPHYRDLMERRKALLAGFAKDQIAVYEADRLPDTSQAVRFGAVIMDRYPPRLASAYGAGPWCLYPALDDVPGWSFDRYFAVASRSQVHAQIPCRHGLFPATYVSRHGTLSQFRAIVDLCPEAVDALDGHGRPVLLDLAGLKDVEKLRLAIEVSSDLYRRSLLGHSAMFVAMSSGNADGVEAFMDEGYDLRRDPAIDQRLVAKFLTTSSCRPELRVVLDEIVPVLQERSDLTRSMDELTEAMFSTSAPR